MLFDAMSIQQQTNNTLPDVQQEPGEKIGWNDLTGDEKDAVICLNLERTIREASKRWAAITKKSDRWFFKKVYPRVKPFYKDMAKTATKEAERILSIASIRAARRVVDLVEWPHPDVQMKSAKIILDKALPKAAPGVNLNLQQNFIKMQQEADNYVD